MKFLLLFFPIFLFSAILDDRIYASAQDLCYVDNINSGLSASDYNPTIGAQTFVRNTTTEIFSCESTIPTEYNCDNWISDPFVAPDYEIHKVLAQTSCQIQQDSSTTQGCYNYTRIITENTIDVECQSNCQIPSSSGVPYDRAYSFDETTCNVSNLKSLYANESPTSLMEITDAQYISCSDSPAVTGCYYLLSPKSTSPDNNSTDNNTSGGDPGSGTVGGTVSGFGSVDSEHLASIDNNLQQLTDKLLDDTAINEYDTAETSISNMGQAITETEATIDQGFDSILSTFNALVPPTFTGNSGTTTFTVFIYGKDVVFDLKMFESLRGSFDVLWLLLLAYITFKIYLLIIRDILNKI